MTALYWGLEFTKVLGAYFVLMIVYPSFLCRRFLKGKSLTFRFGFCTTASVLGINTVVLLLGLIHFLNPWVVRILFYGPLVYFIVTKIMSGNADLPMLLRVLNGTFGIRQFLLKCGKWLQRKSAGILKRGFQRIKGHFVEYGLLFVLLAFGCMYFSYGAFQDYSYGFGDIYPHNQWIYALTQGQIFSDGVYPEGMHCFIYAMHTLFGIRIYSCMLFTQGIHVMVFLLSAYLFLKEIFRFRFTPHFALALFLTLDVVCIDSVFGMSRLQWTIPQEFGMYAMFLCPAFLIRYLNTPKEEIRLPQNKWGKKLQFLKKAYYNENLLVFMLAIAVTLAVHFYPTIMAFFLCVAFVPVLFSRIFKSTRFVSLVGAVLVGVLIAVVPMAGALASGIPFQGSINWAMNVINGVEGAASGYMAPDGETDAAGSADGQGSGGLENGGTGSNAGGGSGTDANGNRGADGENNGSDATVTSGADGENSGTGNADGENSTAGGKTPQPPKEPLLTRLKAFFLKEADALYRAGYVTLYKEQRADGFLKMTALALAFFVFCRILAMLLRFVFHRKGIQAGMFDHYLSLTLSTVIFIGMYCAEALGLPALIAGARLCSSIQLLLTAMCMIPVDAAFTLLAVLLSGAVMKTAALLFTGAVYVFTNMTGTFHGYLYYELTRFNGAVMSTYRITETLPHNSYTIVSPVDELYQVIQYGLHEEAVNFVNECTKDDYTIPTEYVFLFVEKHPLGYAQSHFFGGPSWLAAEKYPALYESNVSQCPAIITATISPELAEPPFYAFPISSAAYSDLLSRTVVESRLQKWCDSFEKLYPGELKTYYEDKNFVCYYFRQNPACLYQLAIEDE